MVRDVYNVGKAGAVGPGAVNHGGPAPEPPPLPGPGKDPKKGPGKTLLLLVPALCVLAIAGYTMLGPGLPGIGPQELTADEMAADASGLKSTAPGEGAAASAALLANAQTTPCTPVEAPDPADPRLALIIAQTDYTNGPSDVASAEAEADLIENSLCHLGFKVYRHRNLTKPGLTDALADFRVALDQTDRPPIGFVYYTGHGAQNPNNGQSYLLGTETPLTAASEITAHGIDMRQLSTDMKATSARAIILVFDACRNVAVPGAKGNVKGLGYLSAPPGMLIAYAAETNHVAREGLYAPELAAELLRPDQTVEAMFASVSHRVARRSKELAEGCVNLELCGPQHPFIEPRIYEPIYLAGLTANGALPPAPAQGLIDGAPEDALADPDGVYDEVEFLFDSPADSALYQRAHGAFLEASLVTEEAREAAAQGRLAAYTHKTSGGGCAGNGYEGACADAAGIFHGVHTYGGASEGESFTGRFLAGNRDMGLFQYPYRPAEPNAVATYEGDFHPDAANKAGHWNGYGTVTYHDGSVYTGEVRLGGLDGYGLCYLRDGTEIYGRWAASVLQASLVYSPEGDRQDEAPPGCGKL
jgi:hypothetical protein